MSRHRQNRHHTIRATTFDKRGRIISTALNSYVTTHPIQAKLAAKVGMPACQFLHAEIHALIKARGRKVYKIFVERYDFLGNPKTAAPCKICAKALEIYGVERVEYTVG